MTKKDNQKQEAEKSSWRDLTTAPNIITIVRLAASSIFWIALFVDIKQAWLGVLFWAGAVSDKIDGILARKNKTASKLGKDVLEPMADATFIISAGIYLVIKGDLPILAIEVGLGLVFVGLVAQVILYAARKKWYEKKMISMKLAVGAAYIVLVMYFFSIPTRDLIVWMVVGMGIVTLFDYLKNIIVFGSQRQ